MDGSEDEQSGKRLRCHPTLAPVSAVPYSYVDWMREMRGRSARADSVQEPLSAATDRSIESAMGGAMLDQPYPAFLRDEPTPTFDEADP